MSKLNWIDWSYSKVPASVAKAHGALGCMAYLSPEPAKNISSNEIRDYHQHNLGVVLGDESTEGAMLGGAPAGRAAALSALAQLRAHAANLGYHPKSTLAVPFAVDTDVSPGQFPTLLAAVRAAQAVFDTAHDFPAGIVASVYGEGDLMDYMYAHGVHLGLFQTLAWSYGYISAHTALYQWSINDRLAGYSVDYDQALDMRHLGAWWPPSSPYNTDTEYEDDNMADGLSAKAIAQVQQATFVGAQKALDAGIKGPYGNRNKLWWFFANSGPTGLIKQLATNLANKKGKK